MPNSRIADRKPMEVQFESSEELYWCACGKSGSQPFCDGSHRLGVLSRRRRRRSWRDSASVHVQTHEEPALL